jgi:L-threonylcarbamoyladenylate synthase
MFDYGAHPALRCAAHHVLRGGVVAYPTEAVWGLGADPFNREAVFEILDLKQRPMEKGLILVAASMQQLDFILQFLSESQQRTLASSWPGPRTWLVPHHDRIPHWIHGQFDTVAVRVSAHPVVRALCQAVNGPVVSTSANPQGLAPARFGWRARQYFSDCVEYAPGQVDLKARPSEIRDLITQKIVRF